MDPPTKLLDLSYIVCYTSEMSDGDNEYLLNIKHFRCPTANACIVGVVQHSIRFVLHCAGLCCALLSCCCRMLVFNPRGDLSIVRHVSLFLTKTLSPFNRDKLIWATYVTYVLLLTDDFQGKMQRKIISISTLCVVTGRKGADGTRCEQSHRPTLSSGYRYLLAPPGPRTERIRKRIISRVASTS